MSQPFWSEYNTLWPEYAMTLGQQCNLHGFGLLPCEIGVTFLLPHSVVEKMTRDHVCNVLGMSLPHKLPPACFPGPVLSLQHWFFLGLPVTKLELHITCHKPTNDMLWPPRPLVATTIVFWLRIPAFPFFLHLYHLFSQALARQSKTGSSLAGSKARSREEENFSLKIPR